MAAFIQFFFSSPFLGVCVWFSDLAPLGSRRAKASQLKLEKLFEMWSLPFTQNFVQLQ